MAWLLRRARLHYFASLDNSSAIGPEQMLRGLCHEVRYSDAVDGSSHGARKRLGIGCR